MYMGLAQRPEMSRQRLPIDKDADRPLTKRQQQFVDHIMSTGDSVAVTAEKLGTNRHNIYRELRKPHVKKELLRQCQDHIGVLSLYAARTQGQLLHSDSDHVRAVVASNILDRHLGKPIERKQVALGGRIEVSIDLG